MSAPTGWSRIRRSAQRQKPAAIGRFVLAYTLQTGFDRDSYDRGTSQSVRAHTLQTGKIHPLKQSLPAPKPDAIEDDPQARSAKRTKNSPIGQQKASGYAAFPALRNEKSVNSKAIIPPPENVGRKIFRSQISPAQIASIRPYDAQVSDRYQIKKITTRKIKETN